MSQAGAEREAPRETVSPPHCDAEDRCVTCGDVAVEMLIVRRDASGLALCEAAEGRETVDITLVEPVAAGDRVLVHAGAALARLDVRS